MAHNQGMKQRERQIYDSIAEAYDNWLAHYNALFAADLIDLMSPQKGETALDIAGGSGPAGLKLAERIGTEGSVTIIDISPAMLQQAAKNAAGRMLTNIRTLHMDAEKLDFSNASFDLITCTFGVMTFPDVPKALAEAYRVLKPGGRIGFAVWSVPERFPLYAQPMTIFMDRMAPFPMRLLLRLPLIGSRIRRKILISGGPFGFSPARFCLPGSLERLLRRAGFQSIRRELCAFPLESETFEEFWDQLMKADPTGGTRVSEKILSEIKVEMRRKLVHPKTGGILMFNEAALILAQKPSG